MAEVPEQVKLIDAVDKRTHALIFKVMQKLRGIRAEVRAKIESSELDQNLYSKKLVDRLKVLFYENDKSLRTVQHILKARLLPGVTAEYYRKTNGAKLKKYSQDMEDFVNKVSNVLNRF